jgi:CheY-like chemotaxis protein
MTTTDHPLPTAATAPLDGHHARSVLVVDDDRDIGILLEAVLTDAGYAVSVSTAVDAESVTAAVGRLEPDCVLLDSSGATNDYGDSWTLAERLAVRGRAVPVVMFTAHANSLDEARRHESARSQAARFAGVLSKPFDIHDLEAAVASATEQSVPFDRSPQADAARTAALVAALRDGGATDIHPSTRREWVTLRAPLGRLVQVYWWQQRGVYICGAYDDDNGVMTPLGQFAERDAAIARILAG